MRPVRLNPYHPLTPYVVHAIVFEGVTPVDLTGHAYEYTFSTGALESTKLASWDPDSRLPARNVTDVPYQNIDGLRPINPILNGMERASGFFLGSKIALHYGASMRLSRTDTTDTHAFGPMHTTGNWYRYYVGGGRRSYDSSPVGMNLHGWSYDGSKGTGSDRIWISQNGSGNLGSVFGTIPTTLPDSNMAEISINTFRVSGTSANRGRHVAFVILRDIAIPQEDLSRYTSDKGKFGDWFRGPRARFFITPPTAAGSQSVLPTVATGTASVPNPSITQEQEIQPNVVSGTASVPNPSIAQEQLVQPDVVSGTASVPNPSLAQEQLVQPDLVSGTAAVYDPTVVVDNPGQTLLPDAVTGTASVPNPSLAQEALIQPDLVSGTASVEQPSIAQEQVIEPTIVAGSAQVYLPSISGGLVVAKKGGGVGGRRKRRKTSRRVMIDGEIFWIDSPRDLMRLLEERRERLETQLEQAQEVDTPTTKIRRKLRLVEKRIERVETRVDEWNAQLRRNDEELLTLLSMLDL